LSVELPEAAWSETGCTGIRRAPSTSVGISPACSGARKTAQLRLALIPACGDSRGAQDGRVWRASLCALLAPLGTTRLDVFWQTQKLRPVRFCLQWRIKHDIIRGDIRAARLNSPVRPGGSRKVFENLARSTQPSAISQSKPGLASNQKVNLAIE